MISKETLQRQHQGLLSYFLVYLRGICMGIADVIPGVSGGTIAFITGIYEKLLTSIKSCNKQALSLLVTQGFSAARKHINGTFLVSVFAGIGTSIILFAHLISYLLQSYPHHVWSFFFGLIFASSITILGKIKKRSVGTFLSLLLGAGGTLAIVTTTPTQTPETWRFVMLSGFIAICAMILPGISGSFVLLLLGKYTFILDAVKNLNIPILALFAVGCIGGLLTFSHVVSWMFTKYPNSILAFLTGCMLGSLYKVRPWKEVIETYVKKSGEIIPLVEKSISPFVYQANIGNPHLLASILCFLGGCLLVGIFAFIDKKYARKYQN